MEEGFQERIHSHGDGDKHGGRKAGARADRTCQQQNPVIPKRAQRQSGGTGFDTREKEETQRADFDCALRVVISRLGDHRGNLKEEGL